MGIDDLGFKKIKKIDKNFFFKENSSEEEKGSSFEILDFTVVDSEEDDFDYCMK